MDMGVSDIIDPAEVWNKTPEEFNEWRATGDLPLLLSFFESRLPGFATWRKTFQIDRELFCRLVPTGEWFIAGPTRTVHRNDSFYPHRTLYGTLPVSKARLISSYHERGEKVPENVVEYEPYFSWAKRTLKSRRFFPFRLGQPQRTDTFQYSQWIAFNAAERSREVLLGSFQVVKIGAIELTDNVVIASRNLDFADLDFLRVRGRYHGSAEVQINYSTCKRWIIEDAELNFVTLRECDIQELRMIASQLYRWEQNRCSGYDVRFERTRLRTVQFYGWVPDLEQCDLTDVRFTPPSEPNHLFTADAFRKLRTAYQNIGRRDEASQCYYDERLYQTKALGNPYLDFRERFPISRYGGRLQDIWHFFQKGEFSWQQSIKWAATIPWFHLRIWLTPRYAIRAVIFKAKYLVSLLDWIVWGFGERPARVFVAAPVVVALYAGLYVYLDGMVDNSTAGSSLVRIPAIVTGCSGRT